MKFTQEIKDNWLKALKFGEYKQGFRFLIENEKYYCCIGVLGEITEGLNNHLEAEVNNPGNPYCFLRNTIGSDKMKELYKTNDEDPRNLARDYSNVIPLIEALEVQE